jgi:Cu-Zn family superoxide dismutase
MRRFPWTFAIVVGLSAAGLIGASCSQPYSTASGAAPQERGAARGTNMPGMQMPGMQMPAAQPAAEVTKAVCVVHPLGNSNVKGTVTFTKRAEGVEVVANITGLTPGEHGFHVHEWGDCTSADGMSTGSHYNPASTAHGRPEAAPGARHAGDFGNIRADAQGNANYRRVDAVLALNGPQSIIGRAIIIHANPDDFSQPVGNAGGRVACGVIGIAKPDAAAN